jgi:hypothetical protein
MNDSFMSSASSDSVAPRCDGFYHARSESGDCTYMVRFYPDGEVITVSVAGGWTSAGVMGWFDRRDPEMSKGPYLVLGTSISFTSRSSYGRVDYAGFLDKGVLKISSLSQINGYHEVDRIYAFARVS